MNRLKGILWGCILLSISAGGAGEAKPPDEARIPVLAWVGPPPAQANVGRYRELADCGFTHSFSGFANIADMTRALDAASQAGIKLLVSCPELQSDPQGTVKRLKDHPAVGGYFLRDEPAATDFASLSRWAKGIEAVDDRHVVYINLFPDYATPQQLGTHTYRQYVDRFVKEVPVQMISFDYYPIIDHSVRPSWYANLETISAAANSVEKPFWAFALSLRHYNYPLATVAHLREQVFSDLAYGAQGIEYFTYWSPGDLGGDSPIDAAGKRTPVYDRVKTVNAEIRGFSQVFFGSKVLWVGHTGSPIPQGTRPVRPEPPIRSLSTHGTGAVVSLLARGDQRFLVIVNRDIDARMPITVQFDGTRLIRKMRDDGRDEELAAGDFHSSIEPGDVLIFGWAEKS